MERKTTWTNFLITGISLILLLSSNQCKKIVEPSLKTGNYAYINNTSKEIQMDIYDQELSQYRNKTVVNKYSITVGDSLEFQMQSEFPFPFNSMVETSITGDSVIIHWDTKCITNTRKEKGGYSGSGVFNFSSYDNYSDELIKQSNFALYYTFKDEDFDLALDCE